MPVLGDEDLRKLLRSCEGHGFEDIRDAALLRVMIETGVRLSEATGLKTTDVDLDSGELLVLGKGRRRRTVPFGSRTTGALSRYVEFRDSHPRRARSELWLSRKGALTASGVAQMLNRRCRDSDIDPITYTSFDTRLLTTGWPLVEAKEMPCAFSAGDLETC